MGLEVVRDATQLPLGDMVVFDDGFVVLPPKQCSNDAFLLGLVEWSVWHDGGGSRDLSQSWRLSFSVMAMTSNGTGPCGTFETDCMEGYVLLRTLGLD